MIMWILTWATIWICVSSLETIIWFLLDAFFVFIWIFQHAKHQSLSFRNTVRKQLIIFKVILGFHQLSRLETRQFRWVLYTWRLSLLVCTSHAVQLSKNSGLLLTLSPVGYLFKKVLTAVNLRLRFNQIIHFGAILSWFVRFGWRYYSLEKKFQKWSMRFFFPLMNFGLL